MIGPFGSSGGCHVSLTVVGSDCSMSAVNSAGLDDGAAIIDFVEQNLSSTQSEKQFLVVTSHNHTSPTYHTGTDTDTHRHRHTQTHSHTHTHTQTYTHTQPHRHTPYTHTHTIHTHTHTHTHTHPYLRQR